MANSHWTLPANTDTIWLALFSWFWGIFLFCLCVVIGHVKLKSSPLSCSFESSIYFRYWPIYKKRCSKKYLYFHLHAVCQAIQASSLYMWKSQGYCKIPAEVIWRCAWNIWITFQTSNGFWLYLYPTYMIGLP